MRSRSGRGAFTLVELLVVAVLLIAIFAFVAPHYLGRKSPLGGKEQAPMTQADATVCRTNLQSVRQAIEAAKAGDPDGHLPATLAEVPGVIPDISKCAVGGEPYIYDSATGAVHCPHPGHEGY